ncbi:MAG: caspase family protein [Nitratireductor sp.]
MPAAARQTTSITTAFARFSTGLIVLVCMLVLQVGGSRAESRLALVIGNDNYTNIAKLKKAVNDANAIGDTLAQLGFTVSRANDVERRDMNRAIQNFVQSVRPGDVAMVFYAGHGVEIGGKNYLLPVDVPDADAGGSGFIEAESVALDDILERLRERDARLNVVVLDACRNNPFASSATRSIAGNGGLARISAPQGTFVMYSADIGETALDRLGDDDTDPNSVFTRTLIPLISRSDLDLVDTAREVRRQVRVLAQTVRHEQTPAYYDAVLGEFRFVETPSVVEEQENSDGVKLASLPDETDGPAISNIPSKQSIPTVSRNPSQESESASRAMVVTGGEKDSIRLWDASTRKLISELEGEKIGISTLRFTAGGTRLAVATTDGGLFSYSVPQFKKQNAIYPGFRVTAISEADNHRLILGGEEGSLAAIEADSFAIAWQVQPHTDIISPILVAADRKTAVTASGDGTIVVTRLSDGEVLSRINTLPGKEITDIGFLGKSVVIATHEDGTIAHINIATGRIIAAFDAGHGWISSIDMLEGSAEYVTTGVDGVISFWIAGADRPVRQLRAHDDVASGAKFMTADNTTIMISTGFDGSLKLWDRDARHVLADLDHGSAILHFDFHNGS